MWHEALMMLQNARDLPTGVDRLFASLRISYNALEDDQKRMFLDAAFFFLGRRADTALRAWERYACNGKDLASLHAYTRHKHFLSFSCRILQSTHFAVNAEYEVEMNNVIMCWHRSGFLFPETDLHVLVSSCLVQCSEDGTLSMHAQLRDLAYRLVRDEGSTVQRTRLLSRDAGEVLKDMVRGPVDKMLDCLIDGINGRVIWQQHLRTVYGDFLPGFISLAGGQA